MTKSPITSRSRSGSPRSGADAPPAKKPKPGAAPDAGDAPREPAPSVASSEQVVEQPSATPGLFRRVQRGAALVREYDVEAGTTSGRAAHALALTLARSFRAELHGARVVEVGASDGCAGLNAAKLGDQEKTRQRTSCVLPVGFAALLVLGMRLSGAMRARQTSSSPPP